MRPIHLLLGWLFFALGAIGAVVPGLPTVPFMLLALWAFSRASPRLHDWLFNHPFFGPPIQAWKRHGVIPLRAKVLALASMAASLIYLVGFSDSPGWAVAVAAGLMLWGAVFILRRPSRISG